MKSISLELQLEIHKFLIQLASARYRVFDTTLMIDRAKMLCKAIESDYQSQA